MALGGSRPGAGRPKKSEKNSGAVVRAEKQIRDRLPEIVEAQLSLALGSPPEIRPDRAACEYLINRIMGKPTERLEQDIAGELRIKVEYDDPPEPSETS
jgi:hypothetical protein